MGDENPIRLIVASKHERDAIARLGGRADMVIARRPCPVGSDVRRAGPPDQESDDPMSAGLKRGAAGDYPGGDPSGGSRAEPPQGRHGPRLMTRS